MDESLQTQGPSSTKIVFSSEWRNSDTMLSGLSQALETVQKQVQSRFRAQRRLISLHSNIPYFPSTDSSELGFGRGSCRPDIRL